MKALSESKERDKVSVSGGLTTRSCNEVHPSLTPAPQPGAEPHIPCPGTGNETEWQPVPAAPLLHSGANKDAWLRGRPPASPQRTGHGVFLSGLLPASKKLSWERRADLELTSDCFPGAALPL